MTTIGAVPGFPIIERHAGVDRSTARISFADQMEQTVNQSSEKQQNKLADLEAELATLKSRQLSMSIRDYLHANFTLKEQIAAERLSAGEELDVIGVRFEGRVFKLAGKHLGGIEALAKVSDIGIVQAARPRGFVV